MDLVMQHLSSWPLQLWSKLLTSLVVDPQESLSNAHRGFIDCQRNGRILLRQTWNVEFARCMLDGCSIDLLNGCLTKHLAWALDHLLVGVSSVACDLCGTSWTLFCSLLRWQSPIGKQAVPHWASMLRWIWSISECNLSRLGTPGNRLRKVDCYSGNVEGEDLKNNSKSTTHIDP